MFQFKFLQKALHSHVITYPVPINLNYFFGYGFLALCSLIIQLITGIFLSMHYTAHITFAFISVEHMVRDVNLGWFLRFSHANGASFFFIVLYTHIARGLYYNSFERPRHFIWISGLIIFVLTMATAFIGYVLPWGQMSFWGATVIINLFTALPYVGSDISTFLWGGFSVSNPTLNRFFSLHYLVPFLICGLVVVHLHSLHSVGSTNFFNMFKSVQNIFFYPYFFLKDFVGFLIYLLILLIFIFFYSNVLGHPDNYIEANPLVTPLHIVPEWYFLPFYAILRSIPDKLGGVVAMGLSILIFFSLISAGFIRGSVKLPFFSIFFYQKILNFVKFIFFFIICFLGWLGGRNVDLPYIWYGQLATFLYFFYFILFFLIKLHELFYYYLYFNFGYARSTVSEYFKGYWFLFFSKVPFKLILLDKTCGVNLDYPIGAPPRLLRLVWQ